mgnify:CR=1 FL=1
MTRLGLYESRTFGRISYGFIRDEKGMVYINEDEAEKLGLKKQQFGMLVMQVEKDGPADKAGIQSGDVLLKIGKQNIMVDGVDKGSISNTSISTYFKNGISSDLPFIQKSNDSGASSSTYYCDRQYIVGRADAETNNIAEFGSVYNGGYGAGGLFSLYMQRTESNIPSSGTSIASRLVYEP